MDKNEFDEKYVGKKIVIHCKTEELADELLKKADEFGYRWSSGESYICDNLWYICKENTCYDIYDGFNSSINYYKKEGYKIIEFEGFKDTQYKNKLIKKCSNPNIDNLKKMIIDNSALPLIVLVGQFAWGGEVTYEQQNNVDISIEKLTHYKDEWLDEEEYTDCIISELDNIMINSTTTDSEFDEMVDKIVEKTVFIDALVMRLG